MASQGRGGLFSSPRIVRSDHVYLPLALNMCISTADSVLEIFVGVVKYPQDEIYQSNRSSVYKSSALKYIHTVS